jgi:Holliday junction resolvasome RuvABC endonuclease subunit
MSKNILNIQFIEKKLGKQIRQDAISIGFDNAENFSGICILRTDKQKIYIEHLQLIESNQKEDHFHRADHYVDSLNKFKQIIDKYKEHKILVIERCFFGRNVESLIHLAHFGILTYITLKSNVNSYYYFGATTARSIIGFNQRRQEALGNIKEHVITRGKNKGIAKKVSCKQLVHDYLRTDFKVDIKQSDEADGFVLALAGLLQ